MTEKKVIETQYGWYQKNDDKVNVDEIIGIVKTDEQTNSVQLKKEAQLSICEKRVLELEKENEQLKDEIYDELDNALTVLCELYEFIPLSSQSKINSLFNRLKNLRDDIND